MFQLKTTTYIFYNPVVIQRKVLQGQIRSIDNCRQIIERRKVYLGCLAQRNDL
jgi:hypothetical protein